MQWKTVRLLLVGWVSLFALTGMIGCSSQPKQDPQDVMQKERIKERTDALVKVQRELALAYLERGEYQLVRESVQRALHHQPQNAELWYLLALPDLREKKWGQAMQNFQTALQWKPEYPEAQNGIGMLLCLQGKVAEAGQWFDRAAQHQDYETPEFAQNNKKLCSSMAQSSGTAIATEKRAEIVLSE